MAYGRTFRNKDSSMVEESAYLLMRMVSASQL